MAKTSTYIVFVAASLLCVTHATAGAVTGVTWERFSKCPTGSVGSSSSGLYRQVSGRSMLDCIQMCSKTQLCSGVMACPKNSSTSAEKLICTMTQGAVADEVCSKSADSTSSPAACYYAYKNNQAEEQTTATTQVPTTTQRWCRNGGTMNGDTCVCTYQYAGKDCERYVRDCSEMVDNNYSGPETEPYWIQPVGAPHPFKVRCQFQWGGATALIRRDSNSDFNKLYSVLKTQGIGDDPLVYNYFVGLDNLHYFTTQAAYELNFNTGSSILYDNFTVGPESTSYEINYSRFKTTSTLDNFASDPPMKFSADGHENNQCYTDNSNEPGWYREDCTGLAIFRNGALAWENPKGTLKTINKLNVKFVRKSDYYVDQTPGQFSSAP